MTVVLGGCGQIRHTGGDAGGAVLHQLLLVRTAVPPEASDVKLLQSTDSVWSQGCADGSSHAGWSPTVVQISFIERRDPQDVMSQLGAGLDRLGWIRHDVPLAAGQGPTARWTRAEPSRTSATVFAHQPLGDTSGHWSIDASWWPPAHLYGGDCG